MSPAQVDGIIQTLTYIGIGIVGLLLVVAVLGIRYLNKKKEPKD